MHTMGLFSFLTRNKEDDVQNPCPIPEPTKDDSAMAKSLNELYSGNKVPAMSLSAFFAAVNIVSNSIAMMDWEYKDADGRKLPDSHYLYSMFDNSELPRFNIIKNVVQDMILYGNGFLYVERDRETGRPLTLHYSAAKQTSIFYNELTHKVSYLNYTYSDDWEDNTNYIHIFMNTDNGYIGIGAAKYAYNALDIASTIQKATESYYNTTGQLFGIVTPQGELPQQLGNKKDQIAKLEASWNEARRRTNKGTIFFPADLKFIPLSSTSKDSSLIESREYNAVEVGRFIANINPVVLGDLRHNTYGTLAEAQKEFIIRSLSPIVHCIEGAVNRIVIMPSKWHKQFVDLNEYSILATDQEKQANCLNTLTSAGIMTCNEARTVLNLPPVEGGDKLIIPYSKIEDNTIGNTTEDKNIEPDVKDEN